MHLNIKRIKDKIIKIHGSLTFTNIYDKPKMKGSKIQSVACEIIIRHLETITSCSPEQEWIHHKNKTHPGDNWIWLTNTLKPFDDWLPFIGIILIHPVAYYNTGETQYKNGYSVWGSKFKSKTKYAASVTMRKTMPDKREWIVITNTDHAQDVLAEMKSTAKKEGLGIVYDTTLSSEESEPWILIIDWNYSDRSIALYPLDAISHDPSIANILSTEIDLG